MWKTCPSQRPKAFNFNSFGGKKSYVKSSPKRRFPALFFVDLQINIF
jgi:hypothetical protein